MRESKNQLPPGWITRLFSWLCQPADMDDLLGDMEEIYRTNLKTKSTFRAQWLYLLQCRALLFSYTVKKRKRNALNPQNYRSTQTHIAMYFNYLKMVLRRLRRQLTFSFINIFGLGAGLATCFIILLFIRTEKSFDQFHEDADRMYRMTKTYPMGGQVVNTVEMRNYFMPVIDELIPAIESHCQIKNIEDGVLIETARETFEEGKAAFVTQNFFDFFSFDLKSGSADKVLEEPYTMAISESMARRYFGGDSPVGKVMKVNFPGDERVLDLKVTGLFEDMPVNSHMHMDFLLSMSTGEAENKWRGIRSFVMQHSYFRLQSGKDIAEVTGRLLEIEEEHAPGFFKKLNMHLGVQPVTDIHLKSDMQKEFEANGSEQFLYLLGVLGVFILLIAAFNYMNLATAQALDQAKEVGVRKVLGSQRRQLIARFIFESLTMSMLGLMLAGLIVYLTLPYFSELSGKPLTFDFDQNWIMIPTFIGLTIVLGLLAGIYPALYMSGFQVVKSLKGGLSKQGKTTKVFRKTLVVTQFVMSVTLMLSTGIVFKQFGFLMNKELGIDMEAVVHINVKPKGVNKHFSNLKQALLQNPQIAAVSGSNIAPVNDFGLSQTNGLILPGASEEISMNYLQVDRDFFDFYKVPFLVGEGYDTFEGEATAGLIVNRTAMEQLGFDEQNVLGQQVHVYDGFDPFIVGVTDDFHLESLHKEIGPVYFQLTEKDPGRFNVMSVKITGDDLPETVADIQNTYDQFVTTVPLELTFMDDRIERAYQSEKFFVRTFGVFTTLAIIMACLGALGLAMQVVVSKQKEVGVRKVLGASVTSITGLLTKELMSLVLLANLIAWPLTYWGMNNWLQDFPYREAIGPGIFALVLAASILITFLTVGATSVKAALVNPVKSLKSE
ncbi:MAG: FtsX-like permease family protein [Roseivirga sp.]|nr:FtsX-like permease family protein [Roseivirga sp.]